MNNNTALLIQLWTQGQGPKHLLAGLRGKPTTFCIKLYIYSRVAKLYGHLQ